MLLFGVIEISRLNVAKPCYLSKMSGEGNRFFSFFFFCRLICACFLWWRLPFASVCECDFILSKVKKKKNYNGFSEQPENFARVGHRFWR